MRLRYRYKEQQYFYLLVYDISSVDYCYIAVCTQGHSYILLIVEYILAHNYIRYFAVCTQGHSYIRCTERCILAHNYIHHIAVCIQAHSYIRCTERCILAHNYIRFAVRIREHSYIHNMDYKNHQRVVQSHNLCHFQHLTLHLGLYLRLLGLCVLEQVFQKV